MSYDLPIPFSATLGVPLADGQTITILGKVPDGAKRSEINLLNGGTDMDAGAKAVLHMSFRYPEATLVLNSNFDGKWGSEDRVPVPFTPGQEFDLKLKVHSDRFQILVNGVDVHDWAHRVNHSEVQAMQVKGDIQLAKVNWGGRYYPVPFETGFRDQHLKIGESILLSVTPKGERFHVELVARNRDVLFHYNPRFEKQKVIRNSKKGKVWGHEERDGDFPFHPDTLADIKLTLLEEGVEVSVNGQPHITFKHRTENPAEDYQGLRVDDAVELSNFEIV